MNIVEVCWSVSAPVWDSLNYMIFYDEINLMATAMVRVP